MLFILARCSTICHLGPAHCEESRLFLAGGSRCPSLASEPLGSARACVDASESSEFCRSVAVSALVCEASAGCCCCPCISTLPLPARIPDAPPSWRCLHSMSRCIQNAMAVTLPARSSHRIASFCGFHGELEASACLPYNRPLCHHTCSNYQAVSMQGRHLSARLQERRASTLRRGIWIFTCTFRPWVTSSSKASSGSPAHSGFTLPQKYLPMQFGCANLTWLGRSLAPSVGFVSSETYNESMASPRLRLRLPRLRLELPGRPPLPLVRPSSSAISSGDRGGASS